MPDAMGVRLGRGWLPARITALPRTSFVLALILAVAVAVRVAVLVITIEAPGFTWTDSDQYLSGQAASLVRSGHWQWTWDAVDDVWHGRHCVLSPLYPVFLSLIGAVSNPVAGAVGHILLSVAAVAMLFVAGRSLHSKRAGLVAACLAAFWLSEVGAMPHFMQERLFVPLIIAAFAALLHAMSTNARPAWFAIAGGLFALAALTRVMALYYVPIAAAIIVFGPQRPPRRVVLRQTAAFVAGWLVLVGPYIAAVSAAKGELVLIDNHGAIQYLEHGALSPVTETLTRLAASPVEYLSERAAIVGALLHLNGGRWVQLYGTAWTPEGALGWKLAAHALIDVPLVLVVTLAPLGLMFARARRETWLLVAWIATCVVLTAVAGYGGARYRIPIEFPLILLASVPLAHGLPARVVLRLRMATAMPAATSAALTALLLVQVPASLSARAQYGVTSWEVSADHRRTAIESRVGFYLWDQASGTRMAALTIDSAHVDDGDVHIWVDGRYVAAMPLTMMRDEPWRVLVRRGSPTFVALQIENRSSTGASSPSKRQLRVGPVRLDTAR